MRTSSSSLAASPSACSRTSSRRDRVLGEVRTRREQLDGALDGRVDRLRGDAVAALDELAELVDDGAVATCLEDVQKRLRREDLPDRRGEGGPARLRADPSDLLEHLEQAVRRRMRAQVHVESGDQACRQVVLRSADGDPRRDGSDRLVPDPFVDDVRCLPELVDLDPGGMPEPLQRLGDRLAGHAVERQRERVHGGRDQIRARVDRRQCGCETDTRRALDVEADGEPTRLPNARDELLRAMRDERAGRVVDEDPCRAEVGQLARLLDERVGLTRAPRAVHEPRVERAARARDRRARLAEVRDVVERIVEAEDVDPVLGGARDEAADDVAADGPRADEEAAAERDAERRRDAPLDRADALPRALHAAPHGGVEDTAPGDLEAREARTVEDLRHSEHFGRRQLARQGLLREQPNRRIDELGHDAGP